MTETSNVNSSSIYDMKKVIIRHASAPSRYGDGSLCSVTLLVQELGVRATIFLALADFFGFGCSFSVGTVYTVTGNGQQWARDNGPVDASTASLIAHAWHKYAEQNSCNML